jgi:hypothetical protein
VIAPSKELTASGGVSASVPKIPITQTRTSVARCGLADANISLKVAFGTTLGFRPSTRLPPQRRWCVVPGSR